MIFACERYSGFGLEIDDSKKRLQRERRTREREARESDFSGFALQIPKRNVFFFFPQLFFFGMFAGNAAPLAGRDWCSARSKCAREIHS